MKHLLIIISLLLCLSKVSVGQEAKDFFVDEFQISLNRTLLQDNNTEDRFGFGLGAYHVFLPEKKVNIVFGLEYNRTSQFIKRMYEGRFAHSTDLTYNINCISVPIAPRFNIGSKLFVDIGGFADLLISANRSGTMHTYLPDSIQVVYTTKEFKEKARLSNCFGVFAGIGVRIPISKFELIIKPEYKFGINKLYSYQDDIYNRYFKINLGLKIK